MNYNPQYPMYTPAPSYPAYGQPLMDNLAQMRAQQYAPQPAPTPNTAPPQSVTMAWVQGEAGMKAYLVAAGNSALLFDSESPTFCLKTTDVNGVPLPLRIFDYNERTQTVRTAPAAPQPQSGDYVTRSEFAALEAKIAAMDFVRVNKETEGVANE